MATEIIFGFIGGLGFFFFGMKTMSEGLKKIAGERIKNFLHYVTNVPIIGVLTGTIITILVQSSSATTVMVVGFVNASLMTLKQAICVILGANIGTTFTAWLVSFMGIFKVTKYALPLVGIGFLVMSVSKKTKKKALGQAILGFGLLFVGLSFMKDAFAPLKESGMVTEAFVALSHHPILGVLAGVIFTILLQSSSATIAIVQVLALNGVISFEAAIPIILGDNIGTTITAQMAAVGTNLNARRAAMSHTLFNVIGVAYMLVFVQLGWFQQVVDFIIPGEITLKNIMFHIAVAHSTFNVLNMLVFLPFVSWLERLSIWLVPQRGEMVDYGTQYLETHLLDTPSFALEQVHNEIGYSLKVSRKAVRTAVESLFESDLKKVDKASELETATDNLQSEITQYLVDLSERQLAPEESEELPVLIHNINDIERIGDHAQNLSEISKRKIEENYPFSDFAVKEIQTMWEELLHMFEETEAALKSNNTDLAKQVLLRESKINNLQEEYKLTHVQRLNEGKCQLQSGFLFLEFIDNLEKIGDRLTNIAQSVINKMKWEVEKQEEKPAPKSYEI